MARKRKLKAACYTQSFAYTKASDMGPHYLADKFAPLIARQRAEREAADKAQAEKNIAHIGKIRRA